VSLRVEPLSPQRYAPTQAAALNAFSREPDRPHVKLARITALTHYASEDTLRDKIAGKAAELGADAVIFGKADVIQSMGASPLTSTLSPAGTSGGYGGGWWNPFRLDSWSFLQSGTDASGWVLYLSGVAIRYEHEPAMTGRENDVGAAR
jgi:hypothetical protein